MTRGDYYYLIYCEACGRDYDVNGNPIFRIKTKRQEEQHELFRKIGQVSREISNLRMIILWCHHDRLLQTALSDAIHYLNSYLNSLHIDMKTISQRIPK